MTAQIDKYNTIEEIFDLRNRPKSFFRAANFYERHIKNGGIGEAGRDIYGYAKHEELAEFVNTGWIEGAQQIKCIQIDTPPVSSENHLMASITGELSRPDLFLHGDPECMADFVSEPAHQFVDLLVNISNSYQTTAKELIKHGVNILSLIDSLESQNIRCKITVFNLGTDGDGKSYAQTLTIKTHGEAVNLPFLAYTLAHPSFYRGLFFMAIARRVNKKTLGRPVYETEEVKKLMPEYCDAIIIPPAMTKPNMEEIKKSIVNH